MATPGSNNPKQLFTGPEMNPSEMDECKVMAAMDQWFGCFTVGKQLNNFYRYGHKRGCEEQWEKLKLCIALKTKSKSERERRLKQYAEKREQERRSRPNVLDVWTFRESPPTNIANDSGGSQGDKRQFIE